MRELQTERLKLRHLREGDAQRIFDCWASKREVTKYLTWPVHDNVEQTKAILENWLRDYEAPSCMRYAIEIGATQELIGMIDVVGYRDGRPVIGYCSGPDYWGNGYMTEALRALVRELFALGYTEILIEAMKDNIGSNRVIEKNGFEYVTTYTGPQSRWKPEIVAIHSYRLKNPSRE